MNKLNWINQGGGIVVYEWQNLFIPKNMEMEEAQFHVIDTCLKKLKLSRIHQGRR